MAEAEHLGGGLDIDGWSFLKNETANHQKGNEYFVYFTVIYVLVPLNLNDLYIEYR